MKKIASLSILAFVLCFSACQPSSRQSMANPVIFFTFKGQDNWEIWRMQNRGQSPKVVYRLPRNVVLSSVTQTVIGPQIIEKLKNEPFSMKGSELLETDIWQIGLSPDQKLLSWHETAYWCPGNHCYGQSAIRVLSLENNTLVASYATTDFLGVPSWSPDSLSIVFDQSSASSAWDPQLIYLLNITTTETIQLAQGHNPIYAKNNDLIVAYQLPKNNQLACCQIIHPTQGTTENISLHPGYSSEIAISPDGDHLVVVTYENDERQLNIMDLKTQRNEKLAAILDKTPIREIKWSPDGKLFAILFINPDFKLVVFNTSGEVLFSVKNVRSWKWAENSQEIIMLKRNESLGCNAVDPYFYVVTILSGYSIKLDFPLPIKNILNDRNMMDCQNNLIEEVTW